MNILITGGAGFIGSTTVKELLNEGFHVEVIDIKKGSTSLFDVKDRIEYHRFDVRDYDSVKKVVNEVDGIIHLAAISRVIWGYERPKECIDINIGGTTNVLEAARKSKNQPWVIFGSSREVYGEPDSIPVKEDATKKPMNVYGVSKLAGEMLCRRYHGNYGLRAGILRFSNVYGGAHDILDRVIPRFILNAMNDKDIEIHGGEQLFDFTHLSDTVRGITILAKRLDQCEDKYCEDYHILTGNSTDLGELSNLILDEVKSNSNVLYTSPRSYDVEKFCGDPGKAKEKLGFQASMGIKEGIRRTVRLFKREFGRED